MYAVLIVLFAYLMYPDCERVLFSFVWVFLVDRGNRGENKLVTNIFLHKILYVMKA